MFRLRAFLVTGLAVLAAMAVVAPSASSEPPPDASCAGVLSSFAGQAGIRDDFAPPVSGQRVAFIASNHGDLGFCLSVFLGP
jgi:hypothetical protein